MMKKKWYTVMLLNVVLVMSACANKNSSSVAEHNATGNELPKQQITYLDTHFKVNLPAKKIVTASLEAMEDAAALNVNPIGAITLFGETPNYLKGKLGENVKNVGDKFAPNIETITGLSPDVILSSTKADATITKNLNKIAPTINVSHQSLNWEANLKLMGQLTGKAKLAKKKIATYKKDLTSFKEKNGNLNSLTTIMIRIRGGELYVYPLQTYFNPLLYEDIGFKSPSELNKVKSQSTISVEQFAKIEADVIFVQFYDVENKGNLDFLDKLKANPIWKSIPAVKAKNVHYNFIDPGYQGGTFFSKETFLKTAQTKLRK